MTPSTWLEAAGQSCRLTVEPSDGAELVSGQPSPRLSVARAKAGLGVPRFVGRRLAAGLVAVAALSATTAQAQSIRAGDFELTIAAGGGASLPKDDLHLETVNSFQLLPHLGYFLTGEVGDGALRGNFEILIEPALVHLDAGNSATVGGLAILPRWVFAGSPRVRPYLEAGAGIVGGQVDLRQTNCDVNFLLQGGAGALIFMSEQVALTLGARFQHLSNADRCSQNEGLNSVIGIVGVSYFFR